MQVVGKNADMPGGPARRAVGGGCPVHKLDWFLLNSTGGTENREGLRWSAALNQ